MSSQQLFLVFMKGYLFLLKSDKNQIRMKKEEMEEMGMNKE